MNKRIKELAEQAGFTTNEANMTVGNYRDGNEYFYAEDFIEDELKKFAELIVGECLEACSRANDIRYFVPPTQEQVVLSCMREIETTFRS